MQYETEDFTEALGGARRQGHESFRRHDLPERPCQYQRLSVGWLHDQAVGPAGTEVDLCGRDGEEPRSPPSLQLLRVRPRAEHPVSGRGNLPAHPHDGGLVTHGIPSPSR